MKDDDYTRMCCLRIDSSIVSTCLLKSQSMYLICNISTKMSVLSLIFDYVHIDLYEAIPPEYLIHYENSAILHNSVL